MSSHPLSAESRAILCRGAQELGTSERSRRVPEWCPGLHGMGKFRIACMAYGGTELLGLPSQSAASHATHYAAWQLKSLILSPHPRLCCRRAADVSGFSLCPADKPYLASVGHGAKLQSFVPRPTWLAFRGLGSTFNSIDRHSTHFPWPTRRAMHPAGRCKALCDRGHGSNFLFARAKWGSRSTRYCRAYVLALLSLLTICTWWRATLRLAGLPRYHRTLSNYFTWATILL